MATIEVNKKYYSIPTEWNELQPGQLLQVMQIIYLKNYKAEQMLLRLLQALTGASDYAFFKWDAAEAAEFFYLLVFLLKEDIDFSKNLLPLYVHTDGDGRKTSFYGPADAISNMRMSEFTSAEMFYVNWFDDDKKNTQALNELVATLYRPMPKGYDYAKNPNGDLREPYNQNICAYYAKNHIAYWPPSVKLAVATWFNGCRRKLIKRNPDVFESTGGEPARYGLASIMLEVAEAGLFGNFESVEDVYVGTMMMYLNESITKAKKMEAQSK